MKRTPLLCATGLALAFALLGCGGGGGGGITGGGGTDGGGGGGATTDVTAPAISGVQLSQTSLDFRGGTVTINASISDASGVLSAVATVQQVGGAAQQITLTRQSGTALAGTYTGACILGANQSTSNQTLTYSISLRATDTVGNAAAPVAGGTVTVAPADQQDPVPPPPSFPTM